MKIHWSVFTNVKTMAKAEKLAEALIEEMHFASTSPMCEIYHNGGFRCQFDTPLSAENWQKAIFLSLWQAQQIAQGWRISGDIEHELEAWSDDCNFVGISNLHMLLIS